MLNAPHHDEIVSPPAFVAVDEVPDDLLDPHPLIEEEGDDSRLANTMDSLGIVDEQHLSPLAMNSTAPLPKSARARIVPLRRPLKSGMRGKDVIATKRALSHAGYMRWPKKWTLLAGPFWSKAVKKFKQQHGLPANSVYDLPTHRKLVSLGHFDRYGALLMGQAPRPADQTHMQARDRLEAIALYGYHNRDRIYYTQSAARMSIVRWHLGFPWFNYTRRQLGEDCSSFDTGVFYSAKLPDPNHLGYRGWGYTGTLAEHGVQTVHVQRGDLAFYGRSPFRHVAMHVGYHQRAVSHGSNAGPLLVSTFRYRSDYYYSRSYV